MVARIYKSGQIFIYIKHRGSKFESFLNKKMATVGR